MFSHKYFLPHTYAFAIIIPELFHSFIYEYLPPPQLKRVFTFRLLHLFLSQHFAREVEMKICVTRGFKRGSEKNENLRKFSVYKFKFLSKASLSTLRRGGEKSRWNFLPRDNSLLGVWCWRKKNVKNWDTENYLWHGIEIESDEGRRK